MNPAVFERATVRALMTLPGPVLARFAAGLETHSRSHLDARLRFLLALSSAKPTLDSGTVEQARRTYREMIALLDVRRFVSPWWWITRSRWTMAARFWCVVTARPMRREWLPPFLSLIHI